MTMILREIKDKIEKQDIGYSFQSFLTAINQIAGDESKRIDLKDITPAFQYEIAKHVATKQPLVMKLTINDQIEIVMKSKPIIPLDPIQIIFSKEDFSTSEREIDLDFTFKLNLDNLAHYETGSIFCKKLLETSTTKGGLKDKGKDKYKKYVFSYDFQPDDVYQMFFENHVPVMTIYFTVSYRNMNESCTMRLEEVRIVIWFDPYPTRQILAPGMESAYNLTQLPGQMISLMSESTSMPLEVMDINKFENELIKGVKDTFDIEMPGVTKTIPYTLGMFGMQEKKELNMTVPWGEITDVAISATILKLSSKTPDALDSTMYVATVLQRDQRGSDLYDALVRIFETPDKIPTIRQLIMHTSGLTESLPERFVHGIFDTMVKATSFMANTPLLNMLPTFVEKDDVMEAELVVMLNTMQTVTRQVPAMPFGINTHENTMYDYAILAMLIKRMFESDTNMSAQAIISKVLGFKSTFHWNPQYGPKNQIVGGPETIFSLRHGLFSTMETMGRFMENMVKDTNIVRKQITDRVYTTVADMEFQTMSWMGKYAQGQNPIPIFIKTAGSLFPQQQTFVYMSPHLGIHGSISIGTPDPQMSMFSMTEGFMGFLYSKLSQMATLIPQVPMGTLVEPMVLAPTVNKIMTEIEKTPTSVLHTIIDPAVKYISPNVSVHTGTTPMISFEATEHPHIIHAVEYYPGVCVASKLESKLILDSNSGTFYRLGDKIHPESNIHEVLSQPVILDHSVYHGKDNIYYTDIAHSLPQTKTISTNINTFHARLHQSPIQTLIQPGTLDPKEITSLTQEKPKQPFYISSIGHCHGKKHKKSYYSHSFHLPFSQF